MNIYDLVVNEVKDNGIKVNEDNIKRNLNKQDYTVYNPKYDTNNESSILFYGCDRFFIKDNTEWHNLEWYFPINFFERYLTYDIVANGKVNVITENEFLTFSVIDKVKYYIWYNFSRETYLGIFANTISLEEFAIIMNQNYKSIAEKTFASFYKNIKSMWIVEEILLSIAKKYDSKASIIGNDINRMLNYQLEPDADMKFNYNNKEYIVEILNDNTGFMKKIKNYDGQYGIDLRYNKLTNLMNKVNDGKNILLFIVDNKGCINTLDKPQIYVYKLLNNESYKVFDNHSHPVWGCLGTNSKIQVYNNNDNKQKLINQSVERVERLYFNSERLIKIENFFS